MTEDIFQKNDDWKRINKLLEGNINKNFDWSEAIWDLFRSDVDGAKPSNYYELLRAYKRASGEERKGMNTVLLCLLGYSMNSLVAHCTPWIEDDIKQ